MAIAAFDSILWELMQAHHRLLHQCHQTQHQYMLLLHGHPPRSHHHHWRQHRVCFWPASGPCQPYLEATSASRQYPFFNPVSARTQPPSPVLEGITCVFYGVKTKSLSEETPKVSLHLLGFQPSGKPCSMSLIFKCADLFFH